MVNAGEFDQNDKKYFYLNIVHIKLAARFVVTLQCILIIINLIYSMTRTTTIMLYSWIILTFAIGLIGSLIYGVYKEKRHFILPYLIFQISAICLTILIFFVFTIGIAVSPTMLKTLAYDFGGVNINEPLKDLNKDLHTFTIVTIIFLAIAFIYQLFSFHVIYEFQKFLRNRESNFDFPATSEMDMSIA
uniref:MARVEL domain-containing protein n=1 Tax=Strongyloides stercoralis TaxID=6248 RepID=A0A0K0ETG8_STRER